MSEIDNNNTINSAVQQNDELATQDYIDLMKSSVEQKFDEYMKFEEPQGKFFYAVKNFQDSFLKIDSSSKVVTDLIEKAESDLLNLWVNSGYVNAFEGGLPNIYDKVAICTKVYANWTPNTLIDVIQREYNTFVYVLDCILSTVENLTNAINNLPQTITPVDPPTQNTNNELDPTDPNTLRYDLWITEKPANYNREVAREILTGNAQFSFNLIDSVDSVLDMIDNLFAKDDMGMLKENAITTPIKIMIGQKYTDVQYVRYEFINRFGEYDVANTTYEKVFFKITGYETVATQLGFYNLVLTVSKEEDQNVAHNLALNLVSILRFFEFISNDEEKNKLYDKIKAASVDGGQVKIINLQPNEALWAVKKYLEINLIQHNPALEIQPDYSYEQSNNNSNENNNTTTTTCSCCVNGTCGQQGAQGEPGPQGIQGEKGEKGDRGEQGLQGPEGPQGIQGVQGPQGEKGEKGDSGDSGPQGVQGIQGIQGPQGVKGDQGEQGIQGPQGLQGPQGIQGEKGEKGDRGEPGPQGEPGQVQDIENSEYIKSLKASIDALQTKLNDLEAKLNSQLGFVEKIFSWIKEIILGIFGKNNAQ